MAKNVPQQVTDESKRTKIFDWNVPLRAQGTTGAISGAAVLARRRRRRAGRRVRRPRRDRAAGRRAPSCSCAGAAARRRATADAAGPAAAARGGLVRRRALAVAGALLAALLIAPAGAGAHALLVDTVPQRGATLREQPRQIVLRFSEIRRGQLRRAARLRRQRPGASTTGAPSIPATAASRLAVGLKPGPARRHVRRDLPRHLRRQPPGLRRPRLLRRRARRRRRRRRSPS